MADNSQLGFTSYALSSYTTQANRIIVKYAVVNIYIYIYILLHFTSLQGEYTKYIYREVGQSNVTVYKIKYDGMFIQISNTYRGWSKKGPPPKKCGTFLSFHQKWGEMLRVTAYSFSFGS